MSGIEPLTCRLQEVRPRAPCALAAPMTHVTALTALAALELSRAPFHETFHGDGRQRSMTVTGRSDRNPPQRHLNLTTWSNRTGDRFGPPLGPLVSDALPNRAVLKIKRGASRRRWPGVSARAVPWEARPRRTPGHPPQDQLIKRHYGTGEVPCEPPSWLPVVQLVAAAPGWAAYRETPGPGVLAFTVRGQGCFRAVRSRYSQSMTVVPAP